MGNLTEKNITIKKLQMGKKYVSFSTLQLPVKKLTHIKYIFFFFFCARCHQNISVIVQEFSVIAV